MSASGSRGSRRSVRRGVLELPGSTASLLTLGCLPSRDNVTPVRERLEFGVLGDVKWSRRIFKLSDCLTPGARGQMAGVPLDTQERLESCVISSTVLAFPHCSRSLLSCRLSAGGADTVSVTRTSRTRIVTSLIRRVLLRCNAIRVVRSRLSGALSGRCLLYALEPAPGARPIRGRPTTGSPPSGPAFPTASEWLC
jgi:hypothetical protein